MDIIIEDLDFSGATELFNNDENVFIVYEVNVEKCPLFSSEETKLYKFKFSVFDDNAIDYTKTEMNFAEFIQEYNHLVSNGYKRLIPKFSDEEPNIDMIKNDVLKDFISRDKLNLKYQLRY